MRVFITSGGTKVPIDSVRDITNMSKGTFGSKIATEALNRGHEVFYFVSKDGAAPFTMTQNFYSVEQNADLVTNWCKWFNWCEKHKKDYTEYRYRTFDDYAFHLEETLKTFDPDVIILAAAVSDYTADPHPSKIRSSDELTIQLFPAEKIISRVKSYCPNAFLVGFKLLVGVTHEELVDAALDSIRKNNCDLIAANDLNSLRAGNHEVLLIESPDNVGGAAIVNRYYQDAAKAIMDRAEKKWNVKCTGFSSALPVA